MIQIFTIMFTTYFVLKLLDMNSKAVNYWLKLFYWIGIIIIIICAIIIFNQIEEMNQLLSQILS